MGLSVPIITDNWGHALEPGIIQIWDEEMRSALDELQVLPRLYNMVGTETRTNTAFGIGASSNPKERPEGGSLPMDSREQLYKLTLTQQSIDKGIPITEEMIRYQEYTRISQMVRQLAVSFGRKRLKDGYNTFNNAFSASYLGPDSKSLCATDHPDSPTSSGTWSNKGTTALSYDSVISTRKLMLQYDDSRDNEMMFMPDILLVPIDLEDIAWTIVNSINKPGTADNDGNFVRSKQMTVIVSRFLTDTNNWFMLDGAMARIHNLWVESDAPTFGLDERSSSYRTNVYAGHMAYDLGWSDARWVYGHEVA